MDDLGFLRRAALLSLWILACVSGAPSPPATPRALEASSLASGGRSRLSPTFDFARLADAALYAFRAGSAGYGVALATYEVAVDARGAIAFTPHAPRVVVGLPSLRLETTAIARGARTSAQPATVAATPDGALTVTRGEVVETLRNDALGLSQSWTFPRSPEGTGDLILRVRVDGLALAASRADGLHFAPAAGGPGVRYGLATFVDAHGTRTPVASQFRDGAVVLTVPAALLDGAAYPAVLDPILSAESSLGSPMLIGSRDSERDPAVATDGTDFLVVWSEQRTNIGLFGARVTADGTVLDPVGIRLAERDPSMSVDYQAEEPAVVYTGAHYLVAYRAARYADEAYLRTVRVARTGTPIDRYPQSPVFTNGAVHAPALATNGTHVLMAWQDRPLFGGTSTLIYGTRIDATGSVDPGSPRALATRAGVSLEQPALASDGTGFLLAWVDRPTSDSAESHAIGVTSEGAPTGSAVALQARISTYSPSISLAFNGTDYVAAWSQSTTAGFRAVTARVRTDGTLRDATPSPVSPMGDTQVHPCVARQGAGVMVAWVESVGTSGATRYSVHGGRVRDDGTSVDPRGITIGAAPIMADAPSLAVGARGALVAWQSVAEAGVSSLTDVYARLVSSDGVPQGTETLLSRTVIEQEHPAVSFDGTQFLVVWNEFRTQSPQLYAARVRADGTVVDTTGFVVRGGVPVLTAPRVSFNGTHHLVVWQSGGLHGRRVARDGTVVDSTTDLSLTSSSAYPQDLGTVASDGTGWLLTWSDHRGSNGDIYASLVLPDGSHAPSDIAVATGTPDQSHPSAGFDGMHYVIAWAQLDFSTAAISLHGRQLAPDGTLSPQVMYASYSAHDPVVVGNGHGVLVAYETGGSAAVVPVGLDGVPGRSVRFTSATTIQYNLTGAFDGTHHIVAWSESRSPSQDILAMRVRPDGTLVDSAPVVISDAPQYDNYPSAASDGRGHTLIAWQRAELAGEYDPGRLRVRVLTNLARGATCETAAQCADGYCVDGVCCDTACGGGAMDDCQVCSAAAGATANGTCSPAPSTVMCRATRDECVRSTTCDGMSTRCPVNAAPAGTGCDGGQCSADGVCTPPPDAAPDVAADAVVDNGRSDVGADLGRSDVGADLGRSDVETDLGRDARADLVDVPIDAVDDTDVVTEDKPEDVDDRPDDSGTTINIRYTDTRSGCLCASAPVRARGTGPWALLVAALGARRLRRREAARRAGGER